MEKTASEKAKKTKTKKTKEAFLRGFSKKIKCLK